MRWMTLGALTALAVAACGGKEQAAQQPAQTPAAQAPAAQAPAAPTGPVVTVQMTGNGTSVAKFEPAAVTVAPGTTVRFVNVSGGPHNISFYADSIPAGAAAVLNAAMTNKLQDLQSNFLTQPNETYDISFANAPEGVYKGYCLPHAALGMKITITVKK